MIGEIRDPETAGIAIQSSMTGHLVISTVHTNDALGVVPRMQDLGARPYLIATTARVFQAQRLVRTLCPNCGTELLSADELDRLQRNDELPPRLIERLRTMTVHRAKPGGCNYCYNTGFSGRTCVMEMLHVSEDVREAIADNVSMPELTRIAFEQGYRPMVDYGVDLVGLGKTTVEEVASLVRTAED